MPSTTAPFVPGPSGAVVPPAVSPAPAATAVLVAPTARPAATPPTVAPLPTVSPAAVPPGTPTEDDIRSYANHLYHARGSTDGHDRDDWLEAEACLRANIPREAAHTRLHHHSVLTARAVLPLIKHGRS